MKELIKGFKEGQKEFGETIAAIINLVLLTIAYVLGIGLTSIFAKIFRKHFLDTNTDSKKETYWEELNLTKKTKEEYFRQF